MDALTRDGLTIRMARKLKAEVLETSADLMLERCVTKRFRSARPGPDQLPATVQP